MTCLEARVIHARGFSIDESSWTGEDIFIASGKPGSIIVTDSVRQLRDDHDSRNVTRTPSKSLSGIHFANGPVDYSRNEPQADVKEVVDEDSAQLN